MRYLVFFLLLGCGAPPAPVVCHSEFATVRTDMTDWDPRYCDIIDAAVQDGIAWACKIGSETCGAAIRFSTGFNVRPTTKKCFGFDGSWQDGIACISLMHHDDITSQIVSHEWGHGALRAMGFDGSHAGMAQVEFPWTDL